MPPKIDRSAYQFCSPKHGGCSYQWTWRGKSHCFGCAKALQPSVATPRPPSGAWAQQQRQKAHHKQPTPDKPEKDKSELQRLAWHREQLVKEFSKDDPLVAQLDIRMAELRKVRDDGKPVWTSVKSIEGQVESKKKKLASIKLEKQAASLEIDKLQLSIAEFEKQEVALELEMLGLEAQIKQAKPFTQDSAPDIRQLLPVLARLPADLVDPVLADAAAQVQQALHALQAMAMAKEKEQKDLQEAKAKTQADQAAAQEGQDGSKLPVPDDPFDEDEGMVEDPEAAEVDSFLASWGPQDLATKPQEEQEAFRKRATEQLRGSPKRQKQG